LDVFKLREQLVRDYRHYPQSILTIKDDRIRAYGPPTDVSHWLEMRQISPGGRSRLFLMS
jgi:hypothetical protein